MKEQYDFSGGKRGAVIKTNKEKITIRLDPDVVDWFRKQVEGGGNYQSLITYATASPLYFRSLGCRNPSTICAFGTPASGVSLRSMIHPACSPMP